MVPGRPVGVTQPLFAGSDEIAPPLHRKPAAIVNGQGILKYA
jgi:hypothetical protein